MKGKFQGGFLDEKIHEPSEGQSAGDHDQEESQAVFDPGLFFPSSEKCHHDRHEEGVEDHGEEMAFKDHDFFPAAMS